MWYLHAMEFYSATKKNEILSFTGKWMELKNIILSEVREFQNTKYLCSFDFDMPGPQAVRFQMEYTQ
jgi:hypothetical protein